MKNILIIPASIKSHVIPCIYLADRLAGNHHINIMVSDKNCEDIVLKNNYTPISESYYRINAGMERAWLEDRDKLTLVNIFISYIRNSIFRMRQEEMKAIIDKLNPYAVFIDIFSSSDFFALYSIFPKENIFFFNPMLSVYKNKGFPDVSANEWPTDEKIEFPKSKKGLNLSLKKISNDPLGTIIDYFGEKQVQKLLKISQIGNSIPIVKNNSFTTLFENVPELILAPLELEFSPDLKLRNQIYLGLAIKTNRVDCELDIKSIDLQSTIISQKKQGRKIVYCSFGTFYRDGMKSILNFIERLLTSTKDMENLFLILSVNKLVVETLKAKYPTKTNTVFYSKVDQLMVLKNADLHITHGGLGSVKESIFFHVPMLVYPLDLRFDQNGNGLKVAYHKIGLNGVLQSDSTYEIGQKITQLLFDTNFKTNIQLLSERIKESYTDSDITEMLVSLIKKGSITSDLSTSDHKSKVSPTLT